MNDLFEREQRVLHNAAVYVNELRNGAMCSADKFENLTKEYGRLLKQLRRITKISDKTTIDLNTSRQDLLYQVNYDALTGIYNRRFMEDNLNQTVNTMRRAAGGMLSVLMVDVDFFKRYNDTYGHSMGDDCLKAVASALNSCIMRAGDFVARYGGEEFAVILPYTDEQGARAIAEKMLESVMGLRIPHEKNDAADCVTVSVGAATGYVDREQSGDEFVRRSDEALYMSKQAGRNRYTFLELGRNEP